MIPGGCGDGVGGLDRLRAALGDALEEIERITDELRRDAGEARAEVERERARLRAERERIASGDAAGAARDDWSARAVRAELVSDVRATVAAVEADDPGLAARRRAHAVRTKGEERP